MLARHAWVFLLLLILCSCGEWQAATRLPSPDGAALASVELKLRGASSTNTTRISVTNGTGGKLLEPGQILKADGAIVGQTRVAWDGPDRLSVTLCEAISFEVRSRLLRAPVTRADGSENAIHVDVINLQYSELENRCR
jgi:hypothetical protein